MNPLGHLQRQALVGEYEAFLWGGRLAWLLLIASSDCVLGLASWVELPSPSQCRDGGTFKYECVAMAGTCPRKRGHSRPSRTARASCSRARSFFPTPPNKGQAEDPKGPPRGFPRGPQKAQIIVFCPKVFGRIFEFSPSQSPDASLSLSSLPWSSALRSGHDERGYQRRSRKVIW